MAKKNNIQSRRNAIKTAFSAGTAGLMSQTGFAQTGHSNSPAIVVASYAEMDNLPALSDGQLVVLTATGISGNWVVDGTGLTANVGTIRDWNNSIGAQRLRRLHAESINVKWFGAAGDGYTNDNDAVQAAIDYCLSFEGALINGQELVPVLNVSGMCRLKSSLKINHTESAPGMFRIVGSGVVGGFVCTSGITIFDTDIKNPKWSMQISFENLTLSTTVSTSYVINYERFARCNFTDCFFDSIRLCTTDDFLISLRLTNCLARFVEGKFIEAKDAYDLHIDTCILEKITDTVIYSEDSFAGCSITNTLIQSNNATCIETPGIAQGLAISGNYFENNMGETLKIGQCAGVTFTGNYVNTKHDNRNDVEFFEVVIGETQGFTGSGNKFSTRGYKFIGSSYFCAAVGAGDNAGVSLVEALSEKKLINEAYGNYKINGFNDSGVGASLQIINGGTSINTKTALKFLHDTSIKNEITSSIYGRYGFGRFIFNGRGEAGSGQTYATLDHEKLELAAGSKLKLGTAEILQGSGTPEGTVAAAVGSLFLRKDGDTGTTFYVKESGTGNTGWVGK